jgi:hypothetical protein
MSLIKNLLLILFTLLFSFSLLVVGDWYIQRTINQRAEDVNKSALGIEKVREQEEDIPQRDTARKNGYLPVIYPSLMDTLDFDFPLIAGLPNAKTYYCNEGHGLVTYLSDRFGFRNVDSKWDEKIDAFFIGDSFVHGACVSNPNTLPSQFEQQTGLTALNLGIGGNNPSHYVTYSELFIPKLQPKNVFLVFYPNDFGLQREAAIKEAYLDEKKDLFDTRQLKFKDEKMVKTIGMEVIALLEGKNSNQNKIGIIQRAVTYFLRHSTLPAIQSLLFRDSSQQFEATRNSVSTTYDLCNQFDCQLNIVFIPNSDLYRPDSRADKYAELLVDLATSYEIPFIDGRNVIDRSKGSGDYAVRGPHLSPNGYAKLAKLIAELKINELRSTICSEFAVKTRVKIVPQL